MKKTIKNFRPEDFGTKDKKVTNSQHFDSHFNL